MNTDDLETLKYNLAKAIAEHGKNSPEEAACLYKLGLYSIYHEAFFDANDYLGDALYIRRMYYTEDSPQVMEVIYALQQTTVM